MAESCEPEPSLAEAIPPNKHEINDQETDVETQVLPQSPKVVVPPTKSKIDLLLKATADAPIMKQKKWSVDPEKTIGWIIEFVRKYLKLDPSESLFLYVNQVFAPSPDQLVRNVYDCFGADGRLVLHYCKNQAWG